MDDRCGRDGIGAMGTIMKRVYVEEVRRAGVDGTGSKILLLRDPVRDKPGTYCSLLIPAASWSTAYYLLLATYYLLLTAYHLPLTAVYLLLTTSYPDEG